MRGDTKPETSLEFKNHIPFFSSLNQKLDEISILGEMTYINLNKLNEYFAKVKNLFNKHYSYIRDPAIVEGQLDKIETAIYDPYFIKDIEAGKTAAKSQQYKLFKFTQKILRGIVNDLSKSELIPKPTEIEEEPWKKEKDKANQVLMKTVMTMLDNNN